MPSDDSIPTKGDQYEHPEGTKEIVFAVDEGRVLTIREYPDLDQFERHIGMAVRRATHEGVANLPDAATFAAGIREIEDVGELDESE